MTAAAFRSRSRPAAVLVLVLVLMCGGIGPAFGGGDWAWPLQPAPRVTRAFDPPSEAWSAGHRGVDLLGAVGQPVLAPAAGRVRFASELAGRGVVVVEVDGLRVTFEPVDAVVSVGDRVRTGQLIGHLQLSQSHCLPAACLHWGVKRGDRYRDPLAMVGDAEIVLLPFLGPGSNAQQTRGPGRPRTSGGIRTRAPSTAAAAAVRFALAQIGDPYVWAAAGPDSWDCSGLTMAAWSAAGRTLPHYSAAQYLQTTPITESDLRPGDLVFWAESSGPMAIFHVALYIGNEQVVHAPRPGTSVRIEGMRSWDEPDYFGRVE
ncbi:MAG: NlpC/P60 family protein [Nocardioidaceae bacterium]